MTTTRPTDNLQRCTVCSHAVPVLVEDTGMCIRCDSRVSDVIYGAAS